MNVAVLMTLHNSDDLAYFELALDSVENQLGFERRTRVYLCCDGTLEDCKNRWLSENSSRFYKLLHNTEHLGHAHCLNLIIENLEDEEFVFRMDSDDICSPVRFEKQIMHMHSHPSVDLIGCQVSDIDEYGNVLGKRDFPIDHETCFKYLMRMNPVLHPTYCIRRNMLRNPIARYPIANQTDDFAFILKLVDNGIKVGNCADRVFSWRLGENFYQRRNSWRRGWIEFSLYCKAVKLNRGPFSLHYIFPLARFVLRLMPSGVQRYLYESELRARLGGLKKTPA